MKEKNLRHTKLKTSDEDLIGALMAISITSRDLARKLLPFVCLEQQDETKSGAKHDKTDAEENDDNFLS